MAKSVDNWQEVSEFDFTKYSQDDLRKANLDFSEFLQGGLLLCTAATMPSTETRVHLAEKFTEDYFSHFGEHLHSVNLYYLANFCMLDFINDRSRSKTLKQKNGFLTPRQLKLRQQRERAYKLETMDYHRTKSLFPDLLPQQRNTQPININE